MNIYLVLGCEHGASMATLRKKRRQWVHGAGRHSDLGGDNKRLTEVNNLMGKLKDDRFKALYDAKWAPRVSVPPHSEHLRTRQGTPREILVEFARAKTIGEDVTFLAEVMGRGGLSASDVVRSIGVDNNLTFAWSLVSLTHRIGSGVDLLRVLMLVQKRFGARSEMSTVRGFEAFLETTLAPARGSWERVNIKVLRIYMKRCLHGRKGERR